MLLTQKDGKALHLQSNKTLQKTVEEVFLKDSPAENGLGTRVVAADVTHWSESLLILWTEMCTVGVYERSEAHRKGSDYLVHH